MTDAYRRAVEEKKQGDAALNADDKRLATMHYRRAIGSLEIYMQTAKSDQKRIAMNVIKKLNTLIEEMYGTKPKNGKTQSEGASTTRITPRGNQDVPKSCEESGGTIEFSKLNFGELAGMQYLKMEMRDAVELPLKYAEEFKRRRIPLQTGILLFGPPGCGKTYMVKCLAGEFQLPAIIVSASTLVESLVGATEKKASKTFECARSIAPSILFVDEIDKLLPGKASTDSTQVMTRTTNEFLTQLDGFNAHEKQSIFIAATNEPENLNPALIRPGRISQIIYIGGPDFESRKALFEIFLRGNRLESVDLNELAKLTGSSGGYDFSSSAITEICTIAKKAVIKEQAKKGAKDMPIKMSHLRDALKKTKPSITPEMKKKYEDFAKKNASLIVH